MVADSSGVTRLSPLNKVQIRLKDSEFRASFGHGAGSSEGCSCMADRAALGAGRKPLAGSAGLYHRKHHWAAVGFA